MKTIIVTFLLILFSVTLGFAQAWMTNLEIAQRLALVQNKMVLMVWEESTTYQYPVLVKDNKGRTIYINNLFEDEYVSPLIWEYFVPVIVSEFKYAELYEKIKGKRSQKYIDKFNDDSIKIMDVNGNILNAEYAIQDFQNITNIINKYAFNTTFLNRELSNYKQEKNFYSAYYLASKYMDLALYSNKKITRNILDLSNIYLNEALVLVNKEDQLERAALKQRCELMKFQEFLILKRPKKVIRELKKLRNPTISKSNEPYVAFLYYTAYMSMEKPKEAEQWKSKISSVNLKKAQKLINLNI